MQEHFVEAGGLCRRLRSQIRAHLFRRIQQFETIVYGKIQALPILRYMESTDAAAFFRQPLGGESFRFDGVVDIGALLRRDILTIQLIEAGLHDRLRICAALCHHALQRRQPASVHPQFERNIVSHFVRPPLPAQQQEKKALALLPPS
ncbi:hypothetical protein SDC9_48619 [bioreactor metagenome]|uniref:Uncharacterized protein n=1 Tax=bioreactor metagenome TaxID=1076179 RepID=A0A644WF26_9ZZZZ